MSTTQQRPFIARQSIRRDVGHFTVRVPGARIDARAKPRQAVGVSQ
ncbi:MAG: hypothetical protein WAU75_09675 [Solirubrobacteraceae bacterium]